MKIHSHTLWFKILAAGGALAVLLGSAPAWPKEALPLDVPIALSPQLRKGKLPNGLTYYIQQNDRPAKQVEMRLVVKAGSVLEDDDQQGLAHFTEHMAFNGSTHFKGHELVSFLQSIGMRFGADLNASTGFDETVYTLSVPTGDPANLDRAMLVLRDWASGLAFGQAEIDKERGVVLEEARRGKGAQDRISKITLPKILEGSKYADRLPIGREDIIQNFPREAVKRFYDDWYRPNLMAVMLVGDVTPARGEALVKKHFAALKNPVPERARPQLPLSPRKLQEAVVATDAEATNNAISISYARAELGPQDSWGAYRVGMLEQLMNQMLSLRLQEQTLLANPPFVAAGAGLENFIRGWREFNASALVGKNGHAAAIRALVAETERVAQFGFTAAELERGKKTYARGMEQYFLERRKSESTMFAEEFTRNFLVDEPVPGIVAEARATQLLLPTITVDEVSALARQWIRGSGSTNKLLIYQGEESASKPRAADLLEALDGAAAQSLSAYSEKAPLGSLLPNKPQGGRVVAEKTNALLGLTEWTLSNGVKVVLKPTEFKNDQILMSGYRPGGMSVLDDADLVNAGQAVPLIYEMGLGNHSPNDLRKLLAGQSVQAGPFMSLLSDDFSGNAGSAELETLLQMTYLYFTQPRRDETAFKSFVAKNSDLLKNIMANPEVRYGEAVLQALYGDSPRRPRMTTVDDLQSLDLDRALALYRSRFGSAKDFRFYLVGSIDLKTAKPLIARYLGGLPVGDLPVGWRDVGMRTPKGQKRVDLQGGTEAKSIVTLILNNETTYTPEADLGLRVLADVLDIRMVDVLREKMGAVYSPSLVAYLGRLPYSRYFVKLTVPCSPDNVEKIIAAALGEMEKIRTEGPTQADLDKVKQNWIKNYRESLATNDFWLYTLRNAQEYGDDPARALGLEARLKALTVADLQKVAQQALDSRNLLRAVLNPEKR